MREPISFFVEGVAKPAGSKRAFIVNRGKANARAIVTDDCAKGRDWKIDVQHAARENYDGEPWAGALHVTLEFFVSRPQGHFRTGRNAGMLREGAPQFPTGKPDVLKLARGVEDALSGLLYVDDSQIVVERITKRYGRPGVQIGMREAEA